MHKGYLITASFLGALAVVLGAFGAHGLKKIVPQESLVTFDTAVRYQFYHVFALALTGILYAQAGNPLVKTAGILFIIGMLFFSGSLYLLTYKTATQAGGLGWVGPITPIGGALLVAGWVCLALGLGKGLPQQ
ncbi:MAG: DUF423 domain-containing protein [Chitinophagaceae bacterium]|jgi:uncharacterized membrane protein YgdD (TMEM256/DUF423 family)|nr:DUF423 domain-containing protein [Chitinophagaceae bacterium]